MIIELESQNIITLPQDIVATLGLTDGDKLEIRVNNGIIYVAPVAVYPKKYVEDLQIESSNLKENIKAGKQPVFDNVDSLIEELEKKR